MNGPMKYTLVLAFSLMASALFAQKFAYVDTDYILSHIQEYVDAQTTLNDLSSQWQGEIEAKYASIVRLEQAYQAEKVLLTQEMRSKREEEIATKRGEALEMQKSKFGVGGELFNKREELIAPIQEQIYTAIQEVASSRSYMVIFDKSNQSNMLYANPKYDVSDLVLKKMGLTPGEVKENAGGAGGTEAGADSGKSGSGKDKSNSGTKGANTPRTGAGGRQTTVPSTGGKKN